MSFGPFRRSIWQSSRTTLDAIPPRLVNMGHIERRISRMEHPDLPDLSPYMTSSNKANNRQSGSSRTSWRPSWMTRSSTSSHSQISSLATSRSDSLSTRIPDANVQNIYHLPAIAIHAKSDECCAEFDAPAFSAPSAMRYEFEDETFEFPLPLAKSPQVQPELPAECRLTRVMQAPSDVRSNNASSRMTTRSKASRFSSEAQSCASGSSSRPTTSMSFSQRTFGTRNPHEAEIEMVSKEQYGYWNASFVARINAAAAVCGGILLTAKFPHDSAAGVNILSRDFCDATAAGFSIELYNTATPDELMHVVRGHGLGSIALMLKASLDATKATGVPVKVALAIFKKMKDTPEKARHTLWPDILKQLKKMPQDRLVLLMFLTRIARRLRHRNISIDGHEPSRHLLEGLFPSNSAISEDASAGQRLSRLLVQHYDEIPADFPVALEAVNYRFPCGKRVNMLALMADKKRDKTGPGGIQEIATTEPRPFRW